MMIRIALVLLAIAAGPPDGPARRPFAIRVVDDATGRGVPLIELRTVDAARYLTDNAGLVAFDEPGLMETDVYFHVRGHGYEYPADGFGFRGKALRPTSGGEATLRVKRINIAERLYRITGGGLYRDSLLLGRPVPLKAPAINGLVLGQDSVVNVLRADGTLLWFWGDTNRPAYPLGNFHVPGATSKLPSRGGLDPDVGVDLTYLVDKDGFARPTARLPGDGPTWIFGVTSMLEDGRDRIFGAYVKVRNLLDVYEHGAVEFVEAKGEWIKRATWPESAPIYPAGQATRVRPSRDSEESVVFARDLPNVRLKVASSYLDLASYEGWTPLRPGSTLDRPEVEVGGDGRAVLGWKRGTPALTVEVQERLVREGKLHPADAPILLRDAETGRPIRPHTSSLEYNDRKGVWSLIVLESGGTSPLGEVWYAEAPGAAGPFVYARKVVTHDRYSFYNPRIHPYFGKGAVLYFEGTYTATFSGNPEQTPRYDYNQIMYRLDTLDPRLNLPMPVVGPGPDPGIASFFAPQSGGAGLNPYAPDPSRKGRLTEGSPDAAGRTVIHLYPSDARSAPMATRPLVEYLDDAGRYSYSTDPDLARPGLGKTGRSPGRAWPSPTRQPIRD